MEKKCDRTCFKLSTNINQRAFESTLYDGSNALKIIFIRDSIIKLLGMKLKEWFSICGQFTRQNNLHFVLILIPFITCVHKQKSRCHNSNPYNIGNCYSNYANQCALQSHSIWLCAAHKFMQFKLELLILQSFELGRRVFVREYKHLILSKCELF